MNVIRSHHHEIFTDEINKIVLSSNDDKRIVIDFQIHTLVYVHIKFKKGLKMSYNVIPNILVDGLILSNKPLSNLEIIDIAKKLSLYGFSGVFLRDALTKKEKLNECGILNLYLSSGDGTHWVIWFKKGKDKFHFDSYGVQPPSELMAYLKSPILYKSERVQQNYLRIEAAFHWEIILKL